MTHRSRSLMTSVGRDRNAHSCALSAAPRPRSCLLHHQKGNAHVEP